MSDKAYGTPADVNASEGNVEVVGPGGIVYSFTPDAAVETSDRLFQGAAEARGQQMDKELRSRKPGS